MTLSPQRDPEHTLAIAETALQQIRALKLPADPASFEVWYAYASGYNVRLNAQIDGLLSRQSSVSASDVDLVHRMFFSVHLIERMEGVGNKLDAEIEQTLVLLEAAINSTSNYQGELVDSNRKLESPIDRDALRAVVEKLIDLAKRSERERTTRLA